MLSNIKTIRKDSGFTIVELLIVIVVIGILAAITIVAYNGISNRAKTTSAQSTAAGIAKKLEAYNAEKGSYPATYNLMTSTGTPAATTSDSFFVGGNDATLVTTALTSAATEKSINYSTCATPDGKRVSYWKFDATAAIQHIYVGGATASSTCTLVTS